MAFWTVTRVWRDIEADTYDQALKRSRDLVKCSSASATRTAEPARLARPAGTESAGRAGALVRAARLRGGVTQADLAKAIGLSRASIANIEAGRQHLSVATLQRIARALAIDASTLMP